MGRYLSETVESVLRNIRPGDEYFIIDGNSTDNSLSVIGKYESLITGWISEKDSGYADALAKGFGFAKGEYLCWVNSGDLLLEGALEKARTALQDTNADLVFGDDVLIDEGGMVLQVTNGHAADLRKAMLYAGWSPLQESCFWTRSIYEQVGGINPNIRYAADYDLFLRMSIAGRCQYLPIIFGAFRRHNGQLSMAKMAVYKAERIKCRARELAALRMAPLRHLIKAYYWLKVRWRVRLQATKSSMNDLVGKPVREVPCQYAHSGLGSRHDI